jgi:hypothetical protein
MRVNIHLATMACAVVLAAAAPCARGDAPCNKGYRDSTAAERATMSSVLQVAKKSIPVAPAGWVIEGNDEISIITNLCRDQEEAPWVYQFGRSYQRVDDLDARNKIIADAAAASQAALARKQPRLDAAMARMDALVKRQVAMIEKGDMAGAQALNEDVAKARADYQKIMDEGDSQAQMEATLAKASRDQYMSVSVQVNGNQVAPDASAKKIAAPAGAMAAFRWTTTRDSVSEDHALIIVGQWRANPDGTWKRVLHPGMAPTAAQVMSISVSADPDRIAGVIGSIDVQSLAAKVPH